MRLARVSEKLARWERITGADLFNAATERVIAQGRLFLCALSTLAIGFEPTQPAQYAPAVTLTLMAYLVFGAILVGLTRYRFLGPRTRQVIHFADVVTISVLLCLTDGPTSPFFVFFAFALVAARRVFDRSRRNAGLRQRFLQTKPRALRDASAVAHSKSGRSEQSVDPTTTRAFGYCAGSAANSRHMGRGRGAIR